MLQRETHLLEVCLLRTQGRGHVLEPKVLFFGHLLLAPPTSHWHSVYCEKCQWQKDLQVLLRSCIQPLSLDFENKERYSRLLLYSLIPLGFPILMQGHFPTKKQSKTFFLFLTFQQIHLTSPVSLLWNGLVILSLSDGQHRGHSAAQTQGLASAKMTAATALLSSPVMLPKPSHITESTKVILQAWSSIHTQ